MPENNDIDIASRLPNPRPRPLVLFITPCPMLWIALNPSTQCSGFVHPWQTTAPRWLSLLSSEGGLGEEICTGQEEGLGSSDILDIKIWPAGWEGHRGSKKTHPLGPVMSLSWREGHSHRETRAGLSIVWGSGQRPFSVWPDGTVKCSCCWNDFFFQKELRLSFLLHYLPAHSWALLRDFETI